MAPQPVRLKPAKVPEYVKCIREAGRFNDMARDYLSEFHVNHKELQAGLRALDDTWGRALDRITQVLGELGPYALRASSILETIDDNGEKIVLKATRG